MTRRADPAAATAASATAAAQAAAADHAGRIVYRPLTRADFGLLLRWLHAPHVTAWWREPPPGIQSIEGRYGPRVDGNSTITAYVIEIGDRPVGLVQCYRIADYPDWDRAIGIPGAAGLDYLIGEPGDCSRGLGSWAVHHFAAVVFDRYPDLDVIVAAPHQDNHAACRALARAGYSCLDIRVLDPADAGPSALYVRHRYDASQDDQQAASNGASDQSDVQPGNTAVDPADPADAIDPHATGQYAVSHQANADAGHHDASHHHADHHQAGGPGGHPQQDGHYQPDHLAHHAVDQYDTAPGGPGYDPVGRIPPRADPSVNPGGGPSGSDWQDGLPVTGPTASASVRSAPLWYRYRYRPDPPEEEVLGGDGVNHVVRIGTTVRRPVGVWTTTVHRLLDHLTAAGFTGAPRAHGRDSHGREVLDFVAGEVGNHPVPGYVRTDATLWAVAGLLRAYHDTTATFVSPPDATWYFPAREPAEVICHGDVAPYNCVFRDGRPVALIDFDTAHPGPRIWDVAYAAYRFVPLTGPGHGEAVIPVDEQIRRLRLFCDVYQLDPARRAALIDTVRANLTHLIRHIRERAGAGDAAFAQHLAAGHDVLYQADSERLALHRDRFRAALI